MDLLWQLNSMIRKEVKIQTSPVSTACGLKLVSCLVFCVIHISVTAPLWPDTDSAKFQPRRMWSTIVTSPHLYSPCFGSLAASLSMLESSRLTPNTISKPVSGLWVNDVDWQDYSQTENCILFSVLRLDMLEFLHFGNLCQTHHTLDHHTTFFQFCRVPL